MKETLKELITYLKNPVLEKDTTSNFTQKALKTSHLLIICLFTSFIITPIFAIIEELGLINANDHVFEELFKTHSKLTIFFLAVILAPFIEELIFRAPITLIKKKKSFKIWFYMLAIVFGLVHITNYNLTTNVLLLTPILVLPQVLLGTYLGYTRVKFGLIYSMLLHAFYNGILLALSFSATS